MTVSELIKELRKWPSATPVIITDGVECASYGLNHAEFSLFHDLKMGKVLDIGIGYCLLDENGEYEND